MNIFDAINADDGDTTLALLSADPDLAGKPHESGPTPVLFALYQGRRELAERLAAAVGTLGLPEAAALDDAERVGTLLDSGTAPDGRTPDGYTPLHLAAFFGAARVSALLLARGADPGAVADNPMRIQALHAAAAGRHLAVATQLIAAGADLDARQRDGWTPLLAAADHGDAELARALLDAGADPLAANEDGQRPAQLARAKGHPELAATIEAAAGIPGRAGS
jgi:ankyrin repeat protein